MGARTSYKSKHREQILSILQENEKEHMTAGQILDELRARGISIGVATIYRQLDRLGEEKQRRAEASDRADYRLPPEDRR